MPLVRCLWFSRWSRRMAKLWTRSGAADRATIKCMNKARCLILACGNTLRGDDGIGPWLAEWAAQRFAAEAGIRVVIRQQWTPELAEEIAGTQSLLFIDASAELPPAQVRLMAVQPAD